MVVSLSCFHHCRSVHIDTADHIKRKCFSFDARVAQVVLLKSFKSAPSPDNIQSLDDFDPTDMSPLGIGKLTGMCHIALIAATVNMGMPFVFLLCANTSLYAFIDKIPVSLLGLTPQHRRAITCSHPCGDFLILHYQYRDFKLFEVTTSRFPVPQRARSALLGCLSAPHSWKSVPPSHETWLLLACHHSRPLFRCGQPTQSLFANIVVILAVFACFCFLLATAGRRPHSHRVGVAAGERSAGRRNFRARPLHL